MNYSNRWYITNEILYVRYWHESTPEIVVQQIDEMYTMLNQSSGNAIHVIVDATYVTKPLSVKDYSKLVGHYKTHPKYRWTLMVAQKNALIRFVSTIGMHLFNTRQRTFDTVDEALAFLKEIDPDINWSQADPSVLTESIPERVQAG